MLRDESENSRLSMKWVLYVCDECGAYATRHFGYSHARCNADFQGGATQVCLHELRKVTVQEADQDAS